MKKALSALLVATATTGATIGLATPAAALTCGTAILNHAGQYVAVDLTPSLPRASVVVCVGTSSVAYQAFEVAVRPGTLGCGTAESRTIGTSLIAETAPGTIGLNGYAAYSLWPQVCSYPDGSYKVVVAGLVCAGSNCTPVGETGAIVGVFKPVVGTEPGAGYQLYGTYLVADNTLYGIGPSHDTYVWVGDGSVTTGDNGALCVLGPNCVPSSVSYDGGTIVGIRLPLAGTTYVTVPGGARCVPLYSLAGPVPCG
ncbi:MAG TPA: hypothetical protein VNQ77_04015 [Frankiaceae bacterium]|nr:hypothetical protein [Frankiaceae bacterium]